MEKKDELILKKNVVYIRVLDDDDNIVFDGKIKEPTAKKLDEYQSMIDDMRKILFAKLLDIRTMKEKSDKFEAENHTVEEMKAFNDSMETEAKELNAKEIGDNKKIVDFILGSDIAQNIWDDNFTPSVRENIIKKFRELANLEEMEKNLETLLPIIK